MAGRRSDRNERRRDWHKGQLDQAASPLQRLRAATEYTLGALRAAPTKQREAEQLAEYLIERADEIWKEAS
jgi:hypothetical protein